MTTSRSFIESPSDPNFIELCEQLAAADHDESAWPATKLDLIGGAGVYHWFVPQELGGLEWSSADIVKGYIGLSSACLTSTFIVTQRVAALRRICLTQNTDLRDAILPGLMSGTESATVGISHLTTSRQHVDRPVLRATATDGGFIVDGFSPWVTGGAGAAFLFLGAQMQSDEQILFVVPSDAPGITIDPGFDLVALTGSQTGAVKCENLFVTHDQIVGGPAKNVLATMGVATGSYQTSALAIGLSKSAITFLEKEAKQRPELVENFDALSEQFNELQDRVLKLASGIEVCTREDLRSDANSLALRSTQSALVAAKGAGFVAGHPVGRWCKEAMFFLVWSCPQAVLSSNLCEFAGIE
jgi:alkylation response protein AidB-like acyl-CoA dehydrogenase